MSARVVYLVHGESGAYEERSEWIVDAWSGKKNAGLRASYLTKIARELRDALDAHR